MPLGSDDGNVYDSEAQALVEYNSPPRARITVSKGPGESDVGEPSRSSGIAPATTLPAPSNKFTSEAPRAPESAPTEPSTFDPAVETAMDNYFADKGKPDTLVMPGQEEKLKKIQDAQGAAREFLQTLDNTVYHSQMYGAYTPGQGPAMNNPVNMAAGAAANIITQPMFLSKKAIDGTLGIMAGVGAKTTNFEKVTEAENLTRRGFHPDLIWQETGLYKATDGKWRHEIVDANAMFKSSKFKEGTKGLPLPEILDHPELYEAYPWLKDIRVNVGKSEIFHGLWHRESKTILLSTNADSPERTLLHEVQHAIQDHEGFTQGTNPAAALSDALYLMDKHLKSIRNKSSSEYKEALSLYDKLYDSSTAANKLYYANRGEQESRLVEVRSALDPNYLRAKGPSTMYDMLRKSHPDTFPPESLVPVDVSPNARSGAMSVINAEDDFNAGQLNTARDIRQAFDAKFAPKIQKLENPKELKLEAMDGNRAGDGMYYLKNEAGHEMANMNLVYNKNTKTVSVGGLYATYPYIKNDLGPKIIIKLREELRRLFPDAVQATAYRVSGARAISGKGAAQATISLLSKEERLALKKDTGKTTIEKQAEANNFDNPASVKDFWNSLPWYQRAAMSAGVASVPVSAYHVYDAAKELINRNKEGRVSKATLKP